MNARAFLLIAALHAPILAQEPCPPTPVYSRCEIALELSADEAALHPNPYASVRINGEFRSPRHRTFNARAFWDGGRRLMIRFAPVDEGDWEYRLTSNVKRFDGHVAKFTATASTAPGFILPRNVHHWSYTENNRPHLWMGDTNYRIGSLPQESFTRIVDARAAQKFTHIRGDVLPPDPAKAFPKPNEIDPSLFRALDERIAYMNAKGIVFDAILGGGDNQLRKLFPIAADRERYLQYVVARYAAFNVTWQLTREFESYDNGRELLREMGNLLKSIDPYQHPRSTQTQATSAPLLGDGWMHYVTYRGSDDDLGAIEHQLYGVPFVNAEFGVEDSGAGKSHPDHVDTNAFRRRLWNATMNGQYPTFGNTGTYGGSSLPQDPKHAESPGAQQMKIWFDFMAATRYWELEPYFDLDGGRAIALHGVEYIVYIEKPGGPVEVRLEKHGYDVAWINPATGERTQAKEFNSEKYIAEPPSNDHDWVLHIYREGRKQSLMSYKFESRANLMQEVESAPAKVPYTIVQPASDEFSSNPPPRYEAKLKRETRGTRAMLYLWTGEVTTDAQGYRVLGSGREGTMRVPRNLATRFPATLSLRLYGMNANGKVYSLDRIYRIVQ